jgi:hypothetical protein
MYELTYQNEVRTFEERMEAVQAAKDLTSGVDGRSTVNVTDGVETLSYRDGKLVAYTYETRRTEGRPEGRDFDSNNRNAPREPDQKKEEPDQKKEEPDQKKEEPDQKKEETSEEVAEK